MQLFSSLAFYIYHLYLYFFPCISRLCPSVSLSIIYCFVSLSIIYCSVFFSLCLFTPSPYTRLADISDLRHYLYRLRFFTIFLIHPVIPLSDIAVDIWPAYIYHFSQNLSVPGFLPFVAAFSYPYVTNCY
ncbi:uncharacterized protein LOC112092361 [Morus notabilis]|uniref:uncharacterized protein LOC112092361 n=1 Tax=Morus notabilis TaxID=981085 RepID=UPI000CED7FAB|nr:uncharacterized protein LOC112092361 [Morus notabilis]